MDSSPILLYYLASILFGLPIIFYILKKAIRKHIPTKEFLRAWNSVFVFGGIVMFILMQTTDYLGYYFHVLLFSYSAFYEVFIGPLFRGPKAEKGVYEIRTMLEKMMRTGPTLVTGRMKKVGYRRTEESGSEGGTTTVYREIWDWEWWEQYQYYSWRNSRKSETQVNHVFDLLYEDQPLIINTFIKILPENEDTKTNYEHWHNMATCAQMKRENGLRIAYFLEEVITCPSLSDKYKPNDEKSSLQLPQILGPDCSRLLVQEPKYQKILSRFPIIGPILRLRFSLFTRTVNLHITKIFSNTPVSAVSDDGGQGDVDQSKSFPFRNNLRGIVISHFTHEGCIVERRGQ